MAVEVPRAQQVFLAYLALGGMALLTGCASIPAGPPVTVTTLRAIEGRWDCVTYNSTGNLPIVHSIVRATSADRADLALTYREAPTIVFPLTLRDGSVHSPYPMGGDRLIPAALTRDSSREYLTLSQHDGRTWLECQRPVMRP